MKTRKRIAVRKVKVDDPKPDKITIKIKPGGPIKIRWAEIRRISPDVIMLTLDADSKHYKLSGMGYPDGMTSSRRNYYFGADEGTGYVRKSKQPWTTVTVEGIPDSWNMVCPSGARYGWQAIFFNTDKYEERYPRLAFTRQR